MISRKYEYTSGSCFWIKSYGRYASQLKRQNLKYKHRKYLKVKVKTGSVEYRRQMRYEKEIGLEL